MEDHRCLINSVCSPRFSSFTQQAGSGLSNALSSGSGKVQPNSPPPPFFPKFVLNSEIGYNSPTQSLQAITPGRDIRPPQWNVELGYWHQMLSFMNEEWIPLLDLISASGRISEQDYNTEVGSHPQRIEALKELISALKGLGQRAMKSPLGIDAQDCVELTLNAWNSFEPGRVLFAFKQLHQNQSLLAELAFQEDVGNRLPASDP